LPQRGTSWMLPEAKGENLLYVAGPASGGVIVYPTTGNLAVIAFNEEKGSFIGICRNGRGKPKMYGDSGFDITDRTPLAGSTSPEIAWSCQVRRLSREAT
jgi:hypothetical protein